MQCAITDPASVGSQLQSAAAAGAEAASAVAPAWLHTAGSGGHPLVAAAGPLAAPALVGGDHLQGWKRPEVSALTCYSRT